MKRILSLLLGLTLCFSLVSTAFAASAADFRDYKRNAWYAESMDAAVKNGLLRGDDQGLLRPDGNLTRAEMAAIMNRAFGAYQTTDISQFRDVQSNKWYYEDMRKAVHMGTYAGNGNGTMTPDNPISREEAMAVVARALQLDNNDYSGTDLSGFPDHASVSNWAVPYVKAMVGADYIHGNPQRQLTPRANITRAEFSQIFYNIIKEYITDGGEYTGNRNGNLLVRTSGVTLKDMTINGDLLIGCGAADGVITLDHVTVTGRVVVWGGGTNAVFMNGGSNMKSLIVCRVDGPVKVIFDKDSTAAVKDKIKVTVTERAKAFPETEVIFYNQNFSSIIDELNKLVTGSEMHVSMDADLFALVDGTDANCRISNDSAKDVYRVEIVRKDNGEAITDSFQLEPGQVLGTVHLKSALPLGNYPCTATVTRLENKAETGTIKLDVTLRIAYLWAQ